MIQGIYRNLEKLIIMIRRTILFLFFISLINLQAQKQREDFYRTIQINKNIYEVGGKTILSFPEDYTNIINFQVPANTVSWYYKFYTYDKCNEPEKCGNEESIDLFSEIEAVVTGGIYSGIIKVLTKPTGLHACDFTLYENGMLNKYKSGSMLAEGLFDVSPKNNLSSNNTLKVENRSSKPIGFTLEIVAIVEDVEAYNAYLADKNLEIERERQQQEIKRQVEVANQVGEGISELIELKRQKKADRLDQDKSRMNSYIKLGFKKIEKENYEEALEVFGEALREKNKFRYAAYYGLATAYREQGQLDNAIQAYKKAIKEAKKDDVFVANCYGGLGLTYLLQKKSLEANKSYIELINIKTIDKEVKRNAIKEIEGKIRKNGNIDGAEDIIEMLQG